MAPIDHTRSNQDDVLVTALATGLSYAEAGEVAGCSKSTVVRRMREPGFRGDVELARGEFGEMLRGRLMQAQPAAVSVLAELMTEARSESDRIRAAHALLRIGQRSGDLAAIDAAELNRFVKVLVDTAMSHLPEESQEVFLRELRAVALRS